MSTTRNFRRYFSTRWALRGSCYSGARLLCTVNVSDDLQTKPVDQRPPDPKTGLPRKYNNWKYTTELSALAVRLGYKMEDVPSLKSALDQHGHTKAISPSRLSLLGKSTMFHYVNEYLYFSYPMMNGSMLLDLSNSITNSDALIELSNYLGITDLIKTKVNLSIPLNMDVIVQSFCGVIGAIYQDRGSISAKKLVHDFILPSLAGKDLEEVIKLEHPRLMLCSILSSQKRPKPVSRLLSESGRATHFPSFVVGVYSGETMLGQGTGTSLRRAEKEAMLTALRSHFQKELSEVALPSDHEDLSAETECEEEIIVGRNDSA